MPSKKKIIPPHKPSTIRIIGGQWRGRKLPVPSADGLRPTGDRIRETLFNWLAPYITSARCLDAYAGTGALGIEALSRGAAFTEFVELNHNTAKNLDENLKRLNSTTHNINRLNFAQWIPKDKHTFDIVFLDPPFEQKLWQSAITHLIDNIPLSDDALIYIESQNSESFTIPSSWEMHKNKSTKQVNATLYKTNQGIPS
ncbi:16S rRNA (guanine(966)-N(2))-methyltransferase RsmD [Agarilytica rhodophyticola]|uniref:16S rRNA (guanine(966)-N(2))-methyltransferase RsmD n=1 Tax=Agarilytica rhodophyticola TaxID=1737490 RepID=UPI001C1F6EF5|nr:16S rRNA (guanine(966)-N(2))-methyltransferase RsmD [Agarilytica rhodophyticola]